jgi:hypothetical protein
MSDIHPDNKGKKRSYAARVATAHARKAKDHRHMGQIRSYGGGDYKPKACRYIFNEDPKAPDWCNQPVKKGTSYCPEHYALCYQDPKKQKKKLTGGFVWRR